jgi:hypothetical protein
MDTAQLKIEALQDFLDNSQWFGRAPFGPARMVDAVGMVENNPELIIALVAWWGKDDEWLPAGWTWVLSLEVKPGGWQVTIDTEPSPRQMFIAADEVVMLFFQTRHIDEFKG